MTETSTQSDVQAALRIIADLHAAYGKGVDMDISGGSSALDAQMWVMMAPSDYTTLTLSVGFWENEGAWTNDGVATSTSFLGAVERVRTFLHEYGHGAR